MAENTSAFWRGFLKGLGDPTAVIWLWALAIPAFALLKPAVPIWWPFVALSAACWLVILGSLVRRRLMKAEDTLP